MTTSATSSDEPISLTDGLGRLCAWAQREPVAAGLLAAILGTLFYFFGFYSVFVDNTQSVAIWAWKAWNPENDLEYGPIILPAALYIVWHHRAELQASEKSSSWLGLGIVFFGVILFVLSVRTLQARLAMLALPIFAYGATRYLWGPRTARIIVFPCVFLLFMLPVGFLVSRTVGLQTMAANVAAKLSGLLGIRVMADGANLEALDGSFHFEVAGGCSGIRSLTAMTMLAALYVHFTQREAWKKIAVFCSSLVFALLGNFMRIFTVVLFAHYISPRIAGGLYHDYSGFVFFPIAVGGMLGFSNLINRDWPQTTPAAVRPPPSARPSAVTSAGSETKPAPAKKAGPAAPASTYDY